MILATVTEVGDDTPCQCLGTNCKENSKISSPETDVVECLGTNCKENSMISSLETDVVELSSETTKIQARLNDIKKDMKSVQNDVEVFKERFDVLETNVVEVRTKTTKVQGELGNMQKGIKSVQDDVEVMNAKFDDLKESLSVITTHTAVSKVTIPADKCSLVQVIVDVSGWREIDHGHTFGYHYAVLHHDGVPVYGGTNQCEYDNSAATGFTSKDSHDSLYGGTVSRTFVLPVKSCGAVLELKQCSRSYSHKAAHMTVLCFP